MNKQFPVSEPLIASNAVKYVTQAITDGWISSAGYFVDEFERVFSEYLGVKHASFVNSGTAALHLALASLDVGPGDEVIIPDQTIISCALAVIYLGAKPVFVDVEADTGNINTENIEEAITENTKAIMVVHLYGHPVDMDPVMNLAKKHNLYVVEDAAEAHGAEYKGKKVGSFGDISTFSFYANKIVTTGEGGMVVTNNSTLYEKVVRLKNLAHDPHLRFYHHEIGYNYRATNIQAALGLAQLEQINEFVLRKRNMADTYSDMLKEIPFLVLPTEKEYAKSVYWMYALCLSEDSGFNRENIMDILRLNGVETRTFFSPLHLQPVLRKYVHPGFTLPISKSLSTRGFYIPSGLNLTTEDITEIALRIKKVFSSKVGNDVR